MKRILWILIAKFVTIVPLLAQQAAQPSAPAPPPSGVVGPRRCGGGWRCRRRESRPGGQGGTGAAGSPRHRIEVVGKIIGAPDMVLLPATRPKIP